VTDQESVNVLYQEIYAKAKKRAQKSLEIIKEACESQVRRKATDFSVSIIGTISEELGGVKTQSIRNVSGVDYRDVITAYSNIYSKVINKKPSGDIYEWVNSIEDQQIRYRVSKMIGENINLRNNENLLKSKTSIDLVYLSEHASNNNAIADTEVTEMIDFISLAALVDFISPDRLKTFKLKAGKHGILYDEDDQPRTLVCFVNAIENLKNKTEQALDNNGLTDTELDALVDFISPDRLKTFKLKVGKHGILYDEDDQPRTLVYFVNAIQNLKNKPTVQLQASIVAD